MNGRISVISPRSHRRIAGGLVVWAFVALSAAPAFAQFSEVATAIAPLSNSAAEWGDYDGDGDLDLALTGADATTSAIPQSRIYRNDAGTFVDINATLIGVEHGSLSWIDYDGDGDLDLLLTGLNVGLQAVTRLYRNDGGTFVDANAGFIDVWQSSAAWADVDDDGDLDVALCGNEFGSHTPLTGFYRNNGGTFTVASSGLASVSRGSVAFADYDNDGDPDLLLTGLDVVSSARTLLYRNDSGTFVDSSIAFVGAYDSAVAWLDADNDGDPDFVLTGRTPGAVARVYHNSNGTSFSFDDLSGPGLIRGSVDWGDYDADGYPDLLLAGADGSDQPHAQLYHSNFGASFSLQSTSFENVRNGSARWGDFDNDYRLDVVLAGFNGSSPVAHLYGNTGAVANTPPSAPSGLSASHDGTTAMFTWNAGGDTQTGSNGLGYNLRIGTVPGADDVVPGHSDAATGYRRVVRAGNLGHVLSWTVPSAALPNTTYWSVQTIDAALAGSSFAAEQTFTLRAATTTSLGSGPNPSLVGQSVGLSATVSPPSATGSVEFKDGAATLGTAMLSGGIATFFTSSLTSGSHTLTAVYAGDSYALGSTSPPVTHVVSNLIISSTALGSSPNPSALGQTVTLTATVTPSSSTGSVSFKDNGTTIGSSTLSGGVATRTTSSLTAGGHILTAVYTGNGSTLGSTSPDLTHLVTQTTTTALNNSPNPSGFGQPVTLTATVTPGAATGTVTFTDNNVPIGTGTVSAGVATLSTSSLAVGPSHPLRAVYGGDTSYAGSTSSLRNQTVLPATSTALGANPNPALTGQTVTITATVTPSGATGTVTFKDGTSTIGSSSLSGGVASLLRVFGPPGTHSLTASYSGNGQYAGSTSPPLDEIVQSMTSTTLVTSPNPSVQGQSIDMTAVVSPGLATGTVSFLDGATILATVPLAGVTQFSTSALTLGSHALTAVYDGDASYRSSTSSVVNQRVDTFTALDVGLPGLVSSSVAWGDYDMDGDLDILMMGQNNSAQGETRVFRNDNGSFVDIQANLPGHFDGSLAWGDYDGDGDLDILMAGNVTPLISAIFRNDNGVFTDIGAGFPGAASSAVAWGDYDNDGDLDVFLSGYLAPGYISRIYRNDAGVFVDIAAALPGVATGSAAWGDLDGDGDLDLVLTGSLIDGTKLARVYRNDGGSFADVAAGLPGVVRGSVALADFDADGDLDILLTGYAGPAAFNPALLISRIYRNDAFSFIDIAAGLTGVWFGSGTWGDQDNDGDYDVLLTGESASGGMTLVYSNTNSAFALLDAGLPSAGRNAGAWGDCDNDGDLDILLSATSDGSTYFSRIYRNSTPVPNTVPSAPTVLSSQLAGNMATFSWDASADAQTPSPGLTYNLRIGTTPGGSDISAGMANSATGYRRVPRLGNTNHRLSWSVRLPPGVPCYWSVQAVDAAFAGSSFAAEQVLSNPPPFVNIEAGLPDLYIVASAWGDYDNDGDLDFLLTGYDGPGFSRLYRNDAGTFADSGVGLPGVYAGSLAWGDYDNDSDLDILITGISGAGRISRIYRNDAGGFVDTDAGLPGVAGTAAWADYDNDGDLDVLLTGSTGTGEISRIYRNDAGSFVDIGAGLPGVAGSTAAWGDYDNDGDLDFVLIGVSGTIRLSRIYRNDGGSFTNIGAGLMGISSGSVAWGDYDGDGDLDLLMSGYTGVTGSSHLYRNDEGVFSDTGLVLPSVYAGSVAWGDYDNDGDLDFLFTGGDSSVPVGFSRLYRNDSGNLVDSGAVLPGVFNGSVGIWGDYDNDGDIDILLGGLADNGSSSFVRVYRNNSTTSNSIPTAPVGLSAQLTGNTATFSWNAATDAQTPASGLTYNLRIGTTPGGDQISSAMANTTSGYRRVPRLGNTNHRLSWSVTLPPAPQYFWSVQAVDAAFAGSPFAAEKVLAQPGFVDALAGLPDVAQSAAAWGDYDGDGDLDLLLTGLSGSGPISRVYQNTSGEFVDIAAGLPGIAFGAVAWGDIDNDGDLDLALSGSTATIPTSRIFRNDGGGFVDIGAGLPGLYASALAWGDYDNDGDLDLVLTGLNSSSVAVTRLSRNEGGTFVDAGDALPEVYEGSVAWGDYDNDGDLDLLFTGHTDTEFFARVYSNAGGSFTDSGTALPGAYESSAAWGDYDNDGDLDILVAGNAGAALTAGVFRNDGGTFVDSGTLLPGVRLSSVTWGDCDNDGDLDFLFTGQSGAGPLARLYRKDGGVFVDSGQGLPGVELGSVAWGDYDDDGDLDFLLTGDTGAGPLTRLFRNGATTPNAIPTAPTNLFAQITGPIATFRWDASSDTQTPPAGLSYNLRVGTTPDGNDLFSGMASATSGYRRVPRLGNAGQRLSFPIRLNSWPHTGHVFWSVQAIDAAFAGSPWASEHEVSGVEAQPEPPAAVALHANTPNPFSGVTHFAFDLPKGGRVQLAVYDVRGRLVKSLRDEALPAGRYEASWDGTDGQGHRVGAGVYLVRMLSNAFKESRRVVLAP